MGHQYKAILHCMETQKAGTFPVPLPDYLDSPTVLKQVRDEKFLWKSQRRHKWWTAASVRAIVPQRPVEALHAGEDVPKAVGVNARCERNATFGAFRFDGADHVWTCSGCRGAFRCAGLQVFCGRPGLAGRGIVLCRCTEVNTVEAIRHWNDGAL